MNAPWPDPWPFALALYRQPGAAGACLALQDRHAADVVLLIGLCWRAGRGATSCDAAEIARLDGALAAWRHDAIVPLRTLRRALKPRLSTLPPSAAEAREQVKTAELAAERVAFDLFARAVGGIDSARRAEMPRAAAALSLGRYLDRLGVIDSETAWHCVDALADATAHLFDASFA